MTNERPGFLLYLNQKTIIDELSNEEVGILIKALYEYEETKEIPKLDKMMKLVFLQFKNTLDNDEKRYEEKCLKNKQNIENYWKKKKNEENTNEYERIRTLTNINKNINTNTNLNTNLNKNINSNKNKNKNININKKNINSVCVKENNNNIIEGAFSCHLGSENKTEACFYCMKKDICPFKESAEFKLKHKKTFKKWNEEKNKQLEQLANNDETNVDKNELLYDYDWLNEE